MVCGYEGDPEDKMGSWCMLKLDKIAYQVDVLRVRFEVDYV